MQRSRMAWLAPAFVVLAAAAAMLMVLSEPEAASTTAAASSAKPSDASKSDVKKDDAPRSDAKPPAKSNAEAASKSAAKTPDVKAAVKTPSSETGSPKKAADKKSDASKAGAKSGEAEADAKTACPAGKKAKAPEPPEPADNSYCLVCHLNYETEKLTVKHQDAGVGCEKCHGESAKHSGDEDGLTPPDVLFAKADIDKFCMTCHDRDKVAKSDYHRELFEAKADERPICTECHGEKHRMAVRTRVWDKKTRKLLSDDGVRMMYKDSPATEGVRPGTKKKSP